MIRTPKGDGNHACDLPVHLDAVQTVRQIISKRAQQAGLPEEDAGLMTVAVVEAFTNIVRHTRGLPAQASIRLISTCTAHDFVVELHHPGQAFSPPEPTGETDFASFPEGGFGLTIIRKACDQVDYLHQDGHNTVRLRRAVPGHGPRP